MGLSITQKNITWIQWIVTLLIPALIYLVPTTEVYTQNLRVFFVITFFIILLVAFELFELLIPAILLPTLYFLSGIVPVNVAFASWTNTTVWMIVGALILADALEECGLLIRIAYYCIRKCGGTFTGIMYGLFFTGMALSIATFSNAFIIMMTMTYGICKAMKLERSNASALICFMGIMGGITTCTFIYNPGYLALGEVGIRTFIPDFAVQWYMMLQYNGVTLLIYLGVIWLLTKIYKTHEVTFAGGKEYFDEQYAKLGPMSPKEKKASVLVLVLMAFLFTGPMHGIPSAYGFMTLPYILYFPGVNVASRNCTKKTNFSIIFFISSCLGIGSVGGALGIGTLISELVSPLLAHTSALMALTTMLISGTIANLFMTPYAMMAGLSAPFAKVALDLGLDPMSSIMTLMISTDMVFFPHEVAGCLLMYSYGLISMSNFIKFGVLKTVLTLLFFMGVVYPFWICFGLT